MFFPDRSTLTLLVLFGRITHQAITNAFVPKLAVDNAVHKKIFTRKTSPFGEVTDYRIPDFKKSNGGRSYFTTKISSTATDDDSATNEEKATLLGTLVLLTVPLSWGTYVPVGKCLRASR